MNRYRWPLLVLLAAMGLGGLALLDSPKPRTSPKPVPAAAPAPKPRAPLGPDTSDDDLIASRGTAPRDGRG